MTHQNEPNPFPTRKNHDTWEVLISPDTNGVRWQPCECEDEARILAAAPVLRYQYDTKKKADQDFVDQLESTARILEKYQMESTARRFHHMARMVRDRIDQDEFNS